MPFGFNVSQNFTGLYKALTSTGLNCEVGLIAQHQRWNPAKDFVAEWEHPHSKSGGNPETRLMHTVLNEIQLLRCVTFSCPHTFGHIV